MKNRHTRLTQLWLDNRYRDPHGHAPGIYYGHEPIYGIGKLECEPMHARRMVRLYQLLKRVRQAGGRSVLDVGGSEGYFAQLCRELFGMEAMSVDLSAEACRRGAELFAMPGCAVDAAHLPFANDSFDLVVCSEVVEHLASPVEAILEMQRVAREAFLLSTEEWMETEAERNEELRDRETTPHGERSFFADVDAKPLFAPYAVETERQIIPNLQQFGDDRTLDLAALRTRLLALRATPSAGEGKQGIVALVCKVPERQPTPKVPSDQQIVDHLLQRTAPVHHIPAVTPDIAWPAAVRLRSNLPPPPKVNGIMSFVKPLPPFSERIDAMLAERPSSYRGQKEDLLALEDKLNLSYDIATAWDFSGELPGGWLVDGHLHGTHGSQLTVDGPDPRLQSPWLGIEAQAAKMVKVEFAVKPAHGSPPDAMAEVFWWVEGDMGFSQSNRVHVVYKPNGSMQTLIFDAPAGILQPNRLLLKLRFDPLSGTHATVSIKRLQIN
jgi:SAM-dependent methyltransferase